MLQLDFFGRRQHYVLMRAAGDWIANVPDYLLNTNTSAITALNNLPTRFAMGGAGASATLPTFAACFYHYESL